MKFVVFSHSGWTSFSYQRYIELLPGRGSKFFFGKVSDEDEEMYGLQSLSFAEIDGLEKGEYTAIVSSPYLLPFVFQIQPKCIIALIDPVPNDEEAGLWQKFTGLLAAEADLIGCCNEEIYMEQCLRHENVMLLQDENKECETIWTEVILAMDQDQSLDSWKQRQWESRAAFYKDLHEQVGDHEEVCYSLASYLYFLNRSLAKEYLTISFEQMILKNKKECLSQYYRFFAAIEAKAGNLDRAVHNYAISAITEEEKLNVKSFHRLLEDGRKNLVQAGTFKLNQDYLSAIRVLMISNDPEARRYLLPNFLNTYRWEEALNLLEKMELPVTEQYFADGIRGILQQIRGKRHEGIHSLLRASVYDWKVLSSIAEMDQWDQAMKKTIRRLNDVK
ncbi:hypothetical protein [Bacillus benzoevorans]|uniref:Uncharacterized protein n=1 Tax=Bacillus benzoevorans TaxID=1456 RepID=A0A7X0HV23_9BACI|nr:hypothetical protein [Bacillus benzoevorans]MBB6447368.1 hypothetical protein [Bacillus benzoevorans]